MVRLLEERRRITQPGTVAALGSILQHLHQVVANPIDKPAIPPYFGQTQALQVMFICGADLTICLHQIAQIIQYGRHVIHFRQFMSQRQTGGEQGVRTLILCLAIDDQAQIPASHHQEALVAGPFGQRPALFK